MNFEKLRDMETFTQDMFNRILAFQERQHAAWDEQRDFAQRIKNLPLHYLVFSNGDRNPETHSTTVNHFYPLRNEMLSLANYIRQLGNDINVIDAHARNGFIGSLLAREGISIQGLRQLDQKPNQIENLFDKERYQLREGSLEELDQADVIVSSWQPAGEDITQQIQRLKPAMVIYIYSDEKHPETGEHLTGTDGAFGEKLLDEYEIVDEWETVRPQDLFHAIWPDLTPSPEEIRKTRVLIHKDLDIEQQRVDAGKDFGYDWEKELEMALTALEAKKYLQQHGFPTGTAI